MGTTVSLAQGSHQVQRGIKMWMLNGDHSQDPENVYEMLHPR